MKLYVAGPMTHYPQFNIPAFDAMSARLRGWGHEVVNPAEEDGEEVRALSLASPDGDPAIFAGREGWGDFLARDVKIIADGGIEGIVVLDGWEKSLGARLETFVGKALCGLPVMRQSAMVAAVFEDVPRIELFRAWTAEPDLAIHPVTYGNAVAPV